MSDEQIQATVVGMKVTDADTAVVERRVLPAEPEARFPVFAAGRKQQRAK